MQDSKLLPCPFCGGEAEMYEQKHREYAPTYYVRCKGCHCKSIERMGVGIVLENWNTRKPIDRMIKRLENCGCYGCEYVDKQGDCPECVTCENEEIFSHAISIVKEEGGLYES